MSARDHRSTARRAHSKGDHATLAERLAQQENLKVAPYIGPDWLQRFQARFSAMLRTPLDRATGTLRAQPPAYDALLRGETLDGPKSTADERLSVYNRQYWFRLFGVVQSAFPLTTRLLGHWLFNDYAARFLMTHPPRGWNIDRVPDGFDAFLAHELPESGVLLGTPPRRLDRLALLDAARIDAAWREVFLAPESPSYRPSAADAARLMSARLVPSPTVALLEEHWPLLALRRSLIDDRSESPVLLPPKLAHSQSWALVRKPAGIGQLALEAREAELFCLLRERPVGDALARLELACSEEERLSLPARTQEWLGRSVELGFWSGLDDEPPRT